MPARHLLILLVATIVCLAAWFSRGRDLLGRRMGEVFSLINAVYIEPVDDGSLFEAAVDGTLAGLDENSKFVRGHEQHQLEAALDQRFGGVGLEPYVDPDTEDLLVAVVLPGGPAAQAGVLPGERIRKIDGTPTAGMSLDDAVARIRGRSGDPVLLTVDAPASAAAGSGQAAREVLIVRAIVELDSVEGDRRRADGAWEWWLEGEPGVAFLRITGFGERTAAEVEAAIATVAAGQRQGDGPPLPLRGLVIDLRGNPGGLVTAAIDVCDALLDEGVIVSTRGRLSARAGREPSAAEDVRRATPGAVAVGVPIAVLVDGDTASAAEIMAACLQDHRRATVVGSRTFGKGTVQAMFPLSGGGILKLTTSELLRPNGRTIHRRPVDSGAATWGVTPDVGFVVEPAAESLERLAEWRRCRDAAPGVVGPVSIELPRGIDDVLARALEALPPASPAQPDLGSEEETARDADESPLTGT